jgi:hypothetical protein
MTELSAWPWLYHRANPPMVAPLGASSQHGNLLFIHMSQFLADEFGYPKEGNGLCANPSLKFIGVILKIFTEYFNHL